MKLGYTDFINKHKTQALIIFAVGILLIFLPPILYSNFLFNYPKLAMQNSFYCLAIVIVSYPLNIKNLYETANLEISFNEYFRQFASDYAYEVFGSIVFWFAIIAIVILFIQHFKQKRVCKPLIYLPLALYILFIVVSCIIYKIIPFIGFYLAIILEVFAVLYCVGFQSPHKLPPHTHKHTDKERIAELERQVAEMKKEIDVE